MEMMKNNIKRVINLLPWDIGRDIHHSYSKLMRPKRIRQWEFDGRPVPGPHAYKQHVINEVRKINGLKTFVETGTFKGHMIEAQRKNFEKLYSIELDDNLFYSAEKNFKNMPHIKIIHGDSAIKLGSILDKIPNDAILFWLDGHYSGDFTAIGEKQCPIFEELDTIFDHHIALKYILVDDARCFIGHNDYPTIEELTKYIKNKDKKLKVEVSHDIIHIF